MSTDYELYDSPIGHLLLVASKTGLCEVRFDPGANKHKLEDHWIQGGSINARARLQLAEYFEGTRQVFDINLDASGTDFMHQVWRELTHIPFGETASYGKVAMRIGRPRASRAVGMANGRNPIPIIVPCHRVIGTDGSLTGFAGGLDLKRRLLAHEAGGSARERHA